MLLSSLECLPCTHKALGSGPRATYNQGVAYTFVYPCLGKLVESGGSEAQGHLQLCREGKASLGYKNLSQKEIKQLAILVLQKR